MTDSKLGFAPLERRTLPEVIRERLQEMILSGELPAGSQLPPERQLCAEFAVARTSVREAIQGLISLGLVGRRGNRTFVVDERPERFDALDDRKIKVRELFEVRRALEPPIVELGARRAEPDQRREIASIAKQFHADLPLEDFRRLDREFHWALAQSCGNELLADLYRRVLDALFSSDHFKSLLESEENASAVRRLVAQSGTDHRRIARAIQRREAEPAIAAMGRHLDSVEENILRQLV